jgi:hypothetical protein
LLTAIEYYINSYKSFSVGNSQVTTFQLLEFINNMKNPDELLTRIQNSDFLENINRDNLILGCICFFVLMRSKSFDPDSLIVKKKIFNILNLVLSKLLVKTNTTNPSKQANDLAESIRKTGNVEKILDYLLILKLELRHLS